MSEAMRFTALYDRNSPTDTIIAMNEVRDRGMIDLRGLSSNRKFMTAARKVLGTGLPNKPRSSVSSGTIACLWLSVDQWLVTCPLKEKDALLAKLEQELQDTHCMISDMSDARAVLRLKGDQVRQVLMKGTSVDFTQAAFAAGAVRRVTFAEIPALVHIVPEEAETFDLFCFRSHAHHVWDWLELTARSGSNIGLPGSLEAPKTV
jgi:sarcosine oxidase subunit gamma